MKLDWNVQRGGEGGGLWKDPFHWGGIDNFWNHPLFLSKMILQVNGPEPVNISTEFPD